MGIYHTSESARTAYSRPIEEAFSTARSEAGSQRTGQHVPDSQHSLLYLSLQQQVTFLHSMGMDLPLPPLTESENAAHGSQETGISKATQMSEKDLAKSRMFADTFF